MRAISFPALAARSLCAAAAVLCCELMPADTVARSGFTDTVASPLVNTPVSAGVVDADGELIKTVGLPEAITTATTAIEQASAAASGTRNQRRVEVIFKSPCCANGCHRVR